MDWICQRGHDVEILLRVVPRASRTEVAGTVGDALKIRLNAPPVEGKANKALLKFLARRLGVRTSEITLLGGETSRNKRVTVTGMTAAHARKRLAQTC